MTLDGALNMIIITTIIVTIIVIIVGEIIQRWRRR
jgi:hypothetical protein